MDIIKDLNLRELLGQITQIVRSNLRGDEELVGCQLYETIDRTTHGQSYHEEIYCVAWFSPSRNEGRQHGTHRVSFNNLGASALCWGRYDMTQQKALADLDRRMEGAPAKVPA